MRRTDWAPPRSPDTSLIYLSFWQIEVHKSKGRVASRDKHQTGELLLLRQPLFGCHPQIALKEIKDTIIRFSLILYIQKCGFPLLLQEYFFLQFSKYEYYIDLKDFPIEQIQYRVPFKVLKSCVYKCIFQFFFRIVICCLSKQKINPLLH